MKLACFWKALPDKRLAEKKKACKGGKKSKLRVTVLYFCEWRRSEQVSTQCDMEI